MLSLLGKRKSTDEVESLEAKVDTEEDQKASDDNKKELPKGDSRAKRKRQKKATHSGKVKSGNMVKSTNQKEQERDENLKEKAEACKEYVRLWRAKDPTWKFKKMTQNAILEVLFDSQLVR
jgi:hypothetical protein